MIQHLRTLPRWLVLLVDIIIVEFSVFLSIFIRFNFSLTKLTNSNVTLIFGIVFAVNLILFLSLRTFYGIIRYTTQRDTFRLILANLAATVIYSFISFFTMYQGLDFNGEVFFLSRATIVINFLVVCFSLPGYRIIVRFLYKAFYTTHLMQHRIKAAVFDTSEQGLLTKRVVNDYPESHMQVKAFIDDVMSKQGKVMEGLQIVSLDDAGFKKLIKMNVQLIIIANKTIAKEKLNLLVDKALQYNIRVQQIPPIQQWLNGKLASEQLKDVNIEDLLEREVIRIDNDSIYHELKGKKILVTGAAGSIGSELVRQLLGYKPSLVILCDKAETPMHELGLDLKEKFPNAPTRAYIGDICDRVRMEHLFEVYNPDIVFHAAAYKHVPLMEENPSVAVVNNVLGTKTLAELAVANNVAKFVMVSTDKAVNPTNIMGASKRIAEIFTQSFFKHNIQGLDVNKKDGDFPTRFVTTRFGNVLGSNGSVIPRFKQQIEKGGPITVTHPEITRYFMTIPEACQLVIEAGVMGQGGEIFVFDMGKPVKIVDLAYKMIRLSGREPLVDIDIVYSGLRPGEKLYEELLNNSENTMPTYHEKIMIATVREYDFAQISDKIETLIECAQKHYTFETVGIMKEIVPEFISKNSTYESLDAKVSK
jgi:FlaA1/EpsC-like NDP-sugar epimerase